MCVFMAAACGWWFFDYSQQMRPTTRYECVKKTTAVSIAAGMITTTATALIAEVGLQLSKAEASPKDYFILAGTSVIAGVAVGAIAGLVTIPEWFRYPREAPVGQQADLGAMIV